MPQITLVEFEDPIDASAAATAFCNVKGDPPFEIYWQKNGRRIHSADGILITRSGQKLSILNIESAQPRHAANYTCVVKSQAGIIKQTTQLRVNGTNNIFSIFKKMFLLF